MGCDDWTAGYVLDDAVREFGRFVTNETKRYANHLPKVPEGSKKEPKTPSMAEVEEYQRALLDGTPFKRIRNTRPLSASRRTRKDMPQ